MAVYNITQLLGEVEELKARNNALGEVLCIQEKKCLDAQNGLAEALETFDKTTRLTIDLLKDIIKASNDNKFILNLIGFFLDELEMQKNELTKIDYEVLPNE